MKICVVGGRLQGTEAIYLAKKAGIEVVLIDKEYNIPAKSFVSEFYPFNIKEDISLIKRILDSVDAILPATENYETLIFLEELSKKLEIPFMQDNSAFWVSSDKVKAYEFFKSFDIPHPLAWPDCGFPVIVKPARKSGSVGISKAINSTELDKALKNLSLIDDKAVVQKYIHGPALSLEVIAKNGEPFPLQITQLKFDEQYGCKCAFAPDNVSDDLHQYFIDVSTKLTKALKLTGLTDIQAIVDKDKVPLIIEINARLPSQTPTVVYHSSGVNMVSLLFDMFVKDKFSNFSVIPRNAVIYQHVLIRGNEIIFQGEHIMSEAKNLRHEENFFGVDEAITNIDLDGGQGVATLIIKDSSLEIAEKRLMKTVQKMMDEFKLTKFSDPSPEGD